MRAPSKRIEVPVGGEHTLADGTAVVCELDKDNYSPISYCFDCPFISTRRKPEYGLTCGDFQCSACFRSDNKETHFKLKENENND